METVLIFLALAILLSEFLLVLLLYLLCWPVSGLHFHNIISTFSPFSKVGVFS